MINAVEQTSNTKAAEHVLRKDGFRRSFAFKIFNECGDNGPWKTTLWKMSIE